MPYTILIVDDDKEFRAEFREILEEEYEVLEAASGEEAVRIIKKPHMIDLTILDVKMPGMQGTEVLMQLKQLEPGLIIVIYTGYASRDIIVESLRKHADDFLEKPIKIEITLKRIKELLERKQNAGKNVIDKLKFYIEKNYEKNIRLKEAAGLVCLSPKYVSKIFKQDTGIGFNTYKIKLKMDKAKELLCLPEYNINEIAFLIGYLNVESFIRIFKKLVGFTPSEYRQQSIKDTRVGSPGIS